MGCLTLYIRIVLGSLGLGLILPLGGVYGLGNADYDDLNTTDRYLPIDIENRPWTDPKDLTIKKRIPFAYMALNFRDFQMNCDGQCFFHSGDSSNPACKPDEKDCNVVISIATHGPKQCNFLGSAIGSRLKESLCNTTDQLYTVSMIRRNFHDSCPSHWNFFLRMPCFPTEYMAVSFYDDGDTSLNDKDRWYACVAGEATLTYWETVVTNPQQVHYTSPYPSVASGVIVTHQFLNDEGRTFACQFIISAQQMRQDRVSAVQFPINGASGSAPTDIKLKYAQGRATRNILDIPIPASLLTPNLDDENSEEINYLKEQQKLNRIEFSSVDPDDEFLFANTFTGPDPNTILFPSLWVEYTSLITVPDQKDEIENGKSIKKEISRCDDPNLKSKVQCFTPNGQRNCIYRERCTVMLIVEKINNDKVKFLMVSFHASFATSKKVLRPFGYSAVAFSKDELMGDDVVVACQFRGEEIQVVVAWNGRHASFLNLTINQGVISNVKGTKFIRKKVNDLYVCGWEMKAKFEMDLTGYPIYRTGQGMEKFSFNFYETHFILIALGSRIYKDRRMGYHSYRQTLIDKLNLKSFNNAHYLFVNFITIFLCSFCHLIIFL